MKKRDGVYSDFIVILSPRCFALRSKATGAKNLSSLFIALFLFLTPLCIRAEDDIVSVPSQTDTISLDLKNIEISELLRILSLKTGKTIVSSKDVTGRITLFLNNVTFQDVLEIIVLSQGLSYEKKGNIIYVMSNAEYKRIYGKEYREPRKMISIKLVYAKPANIFNALSQLKSDIGKIIADEASGTLIIIDIPEKLEALKKAAKELDRPLETAVFNLNYAKPSDAKTHLSAAITPGTGEVIIDERNGKAIVSDLPKKMEKLKNIVKELDEETRQVFIEAEIIQVTLSDTFKRGINWEKVFSETKLHGLDFVGTFPVSPALSAYQKISVGTVAKDKFNVIVNLLDSYGDTKVLSQPRLAVVNNEESHIMVGSREAYVTQTLSQAQTTTVTSEQVQFIDVGIKLKVVPTINKDGFITMKIKPEVSSVRETINTSLGSRIPIVQTSETETVIKIKDGTTIMLGGLLEQKKVDTIDGLPLFSRMPVLGSLFGTRSKEEKKTELVVFITPHLMRGDVLKKGTEPEKFIPGEILPDNFREKAVDRKLKEMENELTESPEPRIKQDVKLEIKPLEDKESLDTTSLLEWQPPVSLNKDGLSRQQAIDYCRKGIVSHKTGDISDAIIYYQKAILSDPGYAPAYNQLGIAFEAKGLPDKAEKMYLKAAEIDPAYPANYSNLALLNESKNNLEKAAAYWYKRASLGDKNDFWAKAALKRLEEIKNLQDIGK